MAAARTVLYCEVLRDVFGRPDWRRSLHVSICSNLDQPFDPWPLSSMDSGFGTKGADWRQMGTYRDFFRSEYFSTFLLVDLGPKWVRLRQIRDFFRSFSTEIWSENVTGFVICFVWVQSEPLKAQIGYPWWSFVRTSIPLWPLTPFFSLNPASF